MICSSTIFHKTVFLFSVPNIHLLPTVQAPEVCFVGRSNSGKSSLINALTNRRNLAFSSKKPGCTRFINFFCLKKQDVNMGYLVDLPGYGYANLPFSHKNQWNQLIYSYLQSRNSLKGIVLILDIRQGFTNLDQSLVNFVKHNKCDKPILAVLNKSDKLPYEKQKIATSEISKLLSEKGIFNTIVMSTTKKIGIKECSNFLSNWINTK